MKQRFSTILALATVIFILGINPGFAQETPTNEDWLGTNAYLDPITMAPWFVKNMDSTTNVGEHVSISIEPVSGMTLISYYDSANADLRLAWYIRSGGNCGPNNAWMCVLVDTTDDVGKYNAIATYSLISSSSQQSDGTGGIPSSQYPPDAVLGYMITYYDATHGALKYAYVYCKPNDCTVHNYTIFTGSPYHGFYNGLYTSVKFDSKNQPHIAYFTTSSMAGDAIWYAHFVGSGSGNCGSGAVAFDWQCDRIDYGEGVGKYASLDIDGKDTPNIAYYDAKNGYPKVAQYYGAFGNCGPSSDWNCRNVKQTLQDTGQNISMYAKDDRDVYIAYYNKTKGTLEYAYEDILTGNCGYNSFTARYEWHCDWIDNMGISPTQMGIAIVEDKAGYPIIAYQDASDEMSPTALKIARPFNIMNPEKITPNCGPVNVQHTWYCKVIDGGGSWLDEANSVAIDINATGLATIAYHELDSYANPIAGNLKIAYQRMQLFLPLVPEE
jgi:hypothetical protein